MNILEKYIMLYKNRKIEKFLKSKEYFLSLNEDEIDLKYHETIVNYEILKYFLFVAVPLCFFIIILGLFFYYIFYLKIMAMSSSQLLNITYTDTIVTVFQYVILICVIVFILLIFMIISKLKFFMKKKVFLDNIFQKKSLK